MRQVPDILAQLSFLEVGHGLDLRLADPLDLLLGLVALPALLLSVDGLLVDALKVVAQLLSHCVDVAVLVVVQQRVAPDAPHVLRKLQMVLIPTYVKFRQTLIHPIQNYTFVQMRSHSREVHRLLDDLVVIRDVERHRVHWLQERPRIAVLLYLVQDLHLLSYLLAQLQDLRVLHTRFRVSAFLEYEVLRKFILYRFFFTMRARVFLSLGF